MKKEKNMENTKKIMQVPVWKNQQEYKLKTNPMNR